MASKSYKRKRNTKIKRSRGSLYKKRKSTGRKVAEVLLLVIVAGALIFVGYSAAGPIISYFKGETSASDEDLSWTPPESSAPEESTSDTEEDTDTGPTPSETQPQASSAGNYVLSEAAMKDTASLAKALAAAKNAGFSRVVLPVKNQPGNLLYKTTVPAVKDSELITGTMTAPQIISVVKSQGLEAAALFPALHDHLTPAYVEDTGYWFADESSAWLDNSPDRGGKRWIDPFRSGTAQFFSSLCAELKSAGFSEILLSDMRFPAFTEYDRTILNGKYFTADRYTALTSLYGKINTAVSGKAAVVITMSDLAAGGGSAEILSDSSFSGTVYLMFDPSSFGNSLKIGDKTVGLPSDPSARSEALLEAASELISTNLTVIPLISSEKLPPNTLADCYEAVSAE